jgi:hypothetical protein
MSAIRVILGIVLGVCALLLGYAAVLYFALPIWLPPVLLIAAAGLFATIRTESRRRAMLQLYWSRGCIGIRWRRRFPDSPKVDIRRFLDFFIDAFGFPTRRRSCFSPDDRILDIYHAMYPPGDALADCMELETFASDIQNHYHVDLKNIWRDDITLGELYARIHKVA